MFLSILQFVLDISDEKLELLTYEASHEGMMDSWRERFSPEEHKQIDNILQVSFLLNSRDFLCNEDDP